MKISKYLSESPVFAINSAYESIVASIHRELKAEGLNLLQGLVLTAVFFEDEGQVSPSILAEQFQTTRGNISHIISHLEYAGLVKRSVSQKDARRFHLELKPAGRKKALFLIKYFDNLQEGFEENLGVKECQRITSGIHQLKATNLKRL